MIADEVFLCFDRHGVSHPVLHADYYKDFAAPELYLTSTPAQHSRVIIEMKKPERTTADDNRNL